MFAFLGALTPSIRDSNQSPKQLECPSCRESSLFTQHTWLPMISWLPVCGLRRPRHTQWKCMKCGWHEKTSLDPHPASTTMQPPQQPRLPAAGTPTSSRMIGKLLAGSCTPSEDVLMLPDSLFFVRRNRAHRDLADYSHSLVLPATFLVSSNGLLHQGP
ncbi:hypothetical protein Hypma_002816 [Hypsizygus marmoreus]|uniref:Uncharacterized protein n=1 Tax=Hypsizygus marmoreus TaxID=39966 RepID=A0A369J4Y7_HYPMA|nr:hypothetical protein Hypma_002816 [Hypsizygus marmoreus]